MDIYNGNVDIFSLFGCQYDYLQHPLSPGTFLSQNTRRIFIFNHVFKSDKNDGAFQSVDIFVIFHIIE